MANTYWGTHRHLNAGFDVIQTDVKVTGAADVAADGYVAAGPFVTSATRTAEGKCSIKFSRTFSALNSAHITWNPSTIGATLVRGVIDTNGVDLAAIGGSVVPVWLYDDSGLLDPDGTIIFVSLNFEDAI